MHAAQYKTMELTSISTHCLAAFSAKDVCVQQLQNAYYRNWTFENLLPCYCYATESNDRTIRSQALQPASAGEVAKMSKLQDHHFMIPEQRTYLMWNVSCRQKNCYCKNYLIEIKLLFSDFSNVFGFRPNF